MIELDFKKSGGLIPAIAQDAATGEVLMMAYINEESWKLTLETGIVHYWSRSRQKLWKKGESSGNIQEVKARHGKIIAIATEGDEEIQKYADHVIYIPHVRKMFSPILTVIPLQILAYHIAVMRGENVDQPRNLAKSVTVE